MSFMKPEVQFTHYFDVETNQGTWIVPADYVGEVPSLDDFSQWVEGDVVAGQEIVKKAGWIARLSAPGYTDCTDWSAHDTEDDARAYLDEAYGGDEEDMGEA